MCWLKIIQYKISQSLFQAGDQQHTFVLQTLSPLKRATENCRNWRNINPAFKSGLLFVFLHRTISVMLGLKTVIFISRTSYGYIPRKSIIQYKIIFQSMCLSVNGYKINFVNKLIQVDHANFIRKVISHELSNELFTIFETYLPCGLPPLV